MIMERKKMISDYLKLYVEQEIKDQLQIQNCSSLILNLFLIVNSVLDNWTFTDDQLYGMNNLFITLNSDFDNRTRIDIAIEKIDQLQKMDFMENDFKNLMSRFQEILLAAWIKDKDTKKSNDYFTTARILLGWIVNYFTIKTEKIRKA